MSLAILNFIRTANKTRKTFSVVSKIMIGFTIITIAVMDYVLASYFEFIGWWSAELYVTYRFFWELIMGITGFYIFFEIVCKRVPFKYISKFLVILIAVIIGEAYLIFFSLNPTSFAEINFFSLLINFYNSHSPMFYIFGGGKLFALIGIMVFCGYICYIVLKNKFYSLQSKILLSIGSLIFIDVVFSIPQLESTIGELNIAYILWGIAYIFILFANLTRINFESLSGIHEILISYKDGRPLYTTGSKQLAPELVTGILSAITSISKEVFDSKKRVRSIDHQDKKILFSYGEFIITSVVAEEETQILFSKVDQLTQEFERNFYGILRQWNGNISPFASAWFIVDKIFPITAWEHKKSVEEFTKHLMNRLEHIKS